MEFLRDIVKGLLFSIITSIVFIWFIAEFIQVGEKKGRQMVYQEAVANGHAQYNPTNGNIEWINIK